MPRKPANNPPPVMTWKKARPVLLLGVLFDALRLMFEGFVVFGPAIGAAFCSYIVSSNNAIADAIGKTSCAVAATAVGVAAAPAIAAFGVIMAMAVGFLGWLIIGGILFKTNRRIFRENAVWFIGSLMLSEIPLVGAIPAITLILWKMYRTQIRKEHADLRKYKEAEAAEERRQALEEAQAQVNAQAQEEIPETEFQPA